MESLGADHSQEGRPRSTRPEVPARVLRQGLPVHRRCRDRCRARRAACGADSGQCRGKGVAHRTTTDSRWFVDLWPFRYRRQKSRSPAPRAAVCGGATRQYPDPDRGDLQCLVHRQLPAGHPGQAHVQGACPPMPGVQRRFRPTGGVSQQRFAGRDADQRGATLDEVVCGQARQMRGGADG
ncbi:hypothetical protein D3C75_906460 [compost metagenome]